MKLLFKSLLLVACLLSFAGCPKPTPTSDIIERYPFDGNLLDSSGHHHDGTSPTPVHYGLDRFGRPSHALMLNGTGGLSVPDSSDLDFNSGASFSLTVWIKTTDTLPAGLICKGPANNAVPGYQLGLTAGGRPHAAITATGTNVELTGPKTAADNRWHLLTLTASPTVVNLYLDTTLVGHQTGAHLKPDSLNTVALHIGANPSGSQQFTGLLDLAKIYDSAISHSTIFANNGERSDPVTAMSDLPAGVTLNPTSGVNNFLGMCWVNRDTGYCCGTNGTIEKSTNGGNQWSALQSGVPGTLRRVSFAPDGLHGVVVGDNGTVLVTSTGGGQWTPATISFPFGWSVNMGDVHITDVRFLDNSNVLLVGRYGPFVTDAGFVMASISQGTTWGQAFLASGAGTAFEALTSVGKLQNDVSHCWVVGAYGQILAWDASTSQWNVVHTDPNIIFRSCDFFSTSIGMAGTDDGKIYSLPGWGASTPFPGESIAGIHMSNPGNPYVCYVCVDGPNQPYQMHRLASTGGGWTASGSPASNPWIFMCSDGGSGAAVLPLTSSLPQISWLQ